eukprot:7064253-Pyramimonas_sp.AAC.1
MPAQSCGAEVMSTRYVGIKLRASIAAVAPSRPCRYQGADLEVIGIGPPLQAGRRRPHRRPRPPMRAAPRPRRRGRRRKPRAKRAPRRRISALAQKAKAEDASAEQAE